MIKEHINRQVIITALILIVISIPMIWFRDLGAHHEISYLAIASDAMHDGRFFTFFREGQHPFTEIPPLYMWLSMLDYALEGARGNLLLAVNAVSAACCIVILDTTFSSLLQKNMRGRAAFCMLSMPFLFFSIYIVSPIVPGMMFALISMSFLTYRVHIFSENSDIECNRGNIAVPLFTFLAFYTSGAAPVLIELILVMFMLLVKKKANIYFRIFTIRYILILLGVYLLNLLLVWYEGRWLFVSANLNTVAEQIFGGVFEGHTIFYYLFSFWYLSLPLGFCAIYAFIRTLIKERAEMHTKVQFAILLPLTAIFVSYISSYRSEYILIYAVVTLPFLFVYYIQKQGARDRIIKWLLLLGIVPFIFLFAVSFFVRSEYVILQNVFVVSSLLFVALFSALAIFKVINASPIDGLSVFASSILIMSFLLGFAMMDINPYISPMKAIKTTLALSNKEKVDKICVSGVNDSWAMKVFNPEVDFMQVSPALINSEHCDSSYRIVGRKTLRHHPEFMELLKYKGTLQIGDSLLLPPGNLKKLPLKNKK